MKLTSELKDDGLISIVPLISRDSPLTSSLSEQRDIVAAKRFFTRAAQQHGAPDFIINAGPAEVDKVEMYLMEEHRPVPSAIKLFAAILRGDEEA